MYVFQASVKMTVVPKTNSTSTSLLGTHNPTENQSQHFQLSTGADFLKLGFRGFKTRLLCQLVPWREEKQMKPQRRASFNLISGSATQPWYENKALSSNPSCSNHQKLPPRKKKFIKILPMQPVNTIIFSEGRLEYCVLRGETAKYCVLRGQTTWWRHAASVAGCMCEYNKRTKETELGLGT